MLVILIPTLEKIRKTGQQEIQQSKSILRQIREVRPVNVAIAKAEFKSAKARVTRAETDLELGLVRTPINIRIYRITI